MLKLPRGHPLLEALRARAREGADTDTGWGVLGPLLISELVAELDLFEQVRPRRDFYPLLPRHFWKVLLPGYLKAVEEQTQSTSLLHLWQQKYRECGYDVKRAPVPGSFLHTQCERLGTLGCYERPYEREELRSLLGNRLKS